MNLGGIIAGGLQGGAAAVGQIGSEAAAAQAAAAQARLESQLQIERDEAITRRRLELSRGDDMLRMTGVHASALIAHESAVERARSNTRAAAERDALAAYNTPEGAAALRGKQALSNASESGSVKASRDAATARDRAAIDEMKYRESEIKRARELRARGDEAGAARIEDTLAREATVRSGRNPAVQGQRSLSDVVAAAKELKQQSYDLNLAGKTEEAQALSDKASELLLSVASARLPGGANTVQGTNPKAATGGKRQLATDGVNVYDVTGGGRVLLGPLKPPQAEAQLDNDTPNHGYAAP